MSPIETIIRNEVAAARAITFARFMELALYCPNFGYYEQMDASPGRKGDYFTSVSVGELFGKLLALRFALWRKTTPSGPWQIVEAGAHDGRLAADILAWFEKHDAEALGQFQYWIVEPSLNRRKSQETQLQSWTSKTRWFESLEAVPSSGVNGFIFSNELLDSMPVHRLGWDAASRKWFEWGVALHDGDFVWARMDHTTGIHEMLQMTGLDFPPELLNVLPDGYIVEVCPSAARWWGQASRCLKSGKLIAFDYGLTADELITPERAEGTLRGYRRHHVNNNVLANAGKQDITAHVNFTAIENEGLRNGLRTEIFVAQERFLADVLARGVFADSALMDWTSSDARQFHALSHPEHLGRMFRVLVQSR